MSSSSDQSEDAAVQDFLEILEAHRKNCERQGKYVEAEIAKNRLDELKLHEENRRREAMRARQIAERLGVEEAHMLEFQQFNLFWDNKMNDYETHCENLMKNMQERHLEEMKDLQRTLVVKQLQPKFSKDLLNLRKIQDTIAKQKNYAEAHKMKLKADALEAWEIEKWHNTRQTDFLAKEEKFKILKHNELNVLKKRIHSGRDQQKMTRQEDLENLLQRYQNVKGELEQQHNLERVRLEKQIQTGILNASSSSSMNNNTGKFSKTSTAASPSNSNSMQMTRMKRTSAGGNNNGNRNSL